MHVRRIQHKSSFVLIDKGAFRLAGRPLADALLGGGMDLLPVPVTQERPIRLRAARQALAETGAALAHALRARL